MLRTMRMALALGSIVAFAACGGGGGPSIGSVNPTSPSYSSLQFAVGTANLYGTSIGLNVVSTFRQTNGTSATGVNTPTITGPFAFTAAVVSGGSAGDPYSPVAPPAAPVAGNVIPGPTLQDQTATKISGTPQTVAPGTPACDGTGGSAIVVCPNGIAPNTTTFGQSGGVFALGLGPYNHVAASGQAYSYQPYAQPFFSSTHFEFIPWGGPPAFDPNGTGMGERDGVGSINGKDSFNNPFFLGVAEGITAFDGITPGTGTYTLNVAVSTVGNGGTVQTSTVSKTAQLTSLGTLPTLTTPLVSLDTNGDGGASFAATLPAGVNEAYVQIVDYGPHGGPKDGGAVTPANCQGPRGTQFAPVYYTLQITASGTYNLPPAIGPNLATTGGPSARQPSHTICTANDNAATTASGSTPVADDIIVQMIGFDYPAYQAALGLTQATTPQNPAITNASGQANITISIPVEEDNNGTITTPLSRR